MMPYVILASSVNYRTVLSRHSYCALFIRLNSIKLSFLLFYSDSPLPLSPYSVSYFLPALYISTNSFNEEQKENQKGSTLSSAETLTLVPLLLHCCLPAFGAFLPKQENGSLAQVTTVALLPLPRLFQLLDYLSAKSAIHINNRSLFQTFRLSDKDSSVEGHVSHHVLCWFRRL